MRGHCRKLAIGLMAICTLFCLAACQAAPLFDASVNLPEPAQVQNEHDSPYTFEENNHLDEGFSTHLPLVTIEFLGEGGTEAEDWFSGLEVTVFDKGEQNSVGDTPSAVIPAKGRVMSNHALEEREKFDYYLRFQDEAGAPAGHSLMGLEKSSEFFLIGAMYDRSLLRNYLGYTLAAQMMEGTPSVRFCEVATVDGDNGYWYQGVYLLVEVKRTEGTALFKRTTAEEGFYLQTYGSQYFPEDGRMEVPITETVTDEEALWQVGGQLSYIEEVIYSDNLDTFSHYGDSIDTDSFIDFFIINELMGNYTAKTDAYYQYNPALETLAMGPVWNFEWALDNEPGDAMDVEELRFDEGGYYERLLKSLTFIDRLKQRYLELRVHVLNEENYRRLIDDAVAYLGPAAGRDWARWEPYFIEHSELQLQPVSTQAFWNSDETVSFYRNAQSHAEEVNRIRYLLREHDIYMGHDLAYLNAEIGAEMRGAEASYVRNTWMFLAFLTGLAITIHFVRRYAE